MAKRTKGIILWWRRQDRRYGWWWRGANLAAALLIAGSVIAPVAEQLARSNRYELSEATLDLTGRTDPKLAKQLTYDAQKQLYQFNKDSVKGDDLPSKLQQASVGAKDKSNTKSYALDVPTQFSKGITYHDTNSQLGFSMVPDFTAMDARTQQGHIVFPLTGSGAGGSQAVYSLKNNGLKEDIIVPKVTSDTMRFDYQLQLPKTLDVRVIPGGKGAIGIYSADPALFGDISFGTDNDRTRVQKAREDGTKSFLVFGLPAPVIVAPNGASIGKAGARFELNGTHLSVVAEGLSGITTPISIDPSVVVTSTSDFQTAGNNEGNIDFDTTDQLKRGKVTGGELASAWTAGTTLTAARNNHVVLAYNGYIYNVGGNSGGTATVEYAVINSDGTLGSWALTTSMNQGRESGAAVIYNGYLIVYGGMDSSVIQGSVESAPINSNGTIGAWTTAATAMNTPVCRMGYAVYNGYVYATGGNTVAVGSCTNSSTPSTIVQYAPVNGDGTIGAWATSSSFTTARMSPNSVAYNGYLYVIEGTTNGSTQALDAQYARLNSDGSVDTWMFTTFTGLPSFGQYRYGMTVYDGYIYTEGGDSGVATAKVYFTHINANGTLGNWQLSTQTMTSPRFGSTMTSYNGFLYITGGSNGSPMNTSEYVPISVAGMTTLPLTKTFTTTRRGLVSVAYNGYLYVMGGDNGGTPINTIYSATIAADGILGTYTASGRTAFTTNRTFFAAFAYNSYMYVLGGCSSTLATCTTAGNNLATVYSSPITVSNGNVNAWTAQTSFTTARYGLQAVVHDEYVYLMGGLNGSTFQNDVQYASLTGASGAITAWTTASATYNLPTARAGFGAVVYGDYMYIAGGCSAGDLTTCTTSLNDVQYAPLDVAGGFAGTWTSTSAFGNARYGLGLTASQNYLYLAGGYDGTTTYSDTQFAAINTDGSIDAWVAGTSTPNASWGVTASSYAGYLYISGGVNAGTYRNTTYYGAIRSGGGGGVGTWTNDAAGLSGIYSSGISFARSFASDGYMYLTGGSDGTSWFGNTYYTTIAADGSLGTWTATTTMNVGRSGFGLVVKNGYVYVAGGNTATGFTATTEYATITPAGGLGSWTTGPSLSSARFLIGMAEYNGYLYTTGGFVGAVSSNLVSYSLIGANGVPGSWTNMSGTSNFTTSRWSTGTFTYNGYLYIMGGYDQAGNYFGDVQYAPLNSDGTITAGAWKYTTSLPWVTRYLQVAPYNGSIYVTSAGFSGFGSSRIMYAPINANGTLGTWIHSATTMPTQNYHVATTIYNGYVYRLGGFNGVAWFTDVGYAPLNAQPRVGHYSKLLSFFTLAKLSGISYNGVLPGDTKSISYRYADATGVFSAPSLASDPITAATCTTSIGLIRYLLVTLTTDDSQTATFPDMDSPYANVTDFTASYNSAHPEPNIRLRGGKTLQASVLSPLDTCIP